MAGLARPDYEQAPVEPGPIPLKLQQSLRCGVDALPVVPGDGQVGSQADLANSRAMDATRRASCARMAWWM
jgi:hypothetical protein